MTKYTQTFTVTADSRLPLRLFRFIEDNWDLSFDFERAGSHHDDFDDRDDTYTWSNPEPVNPTLDEIKSLHQPEMTYDGQGPIGCSCGVPSHAIWLASAGWSKYADHLAEVAFGAGR